LGCRISRLGVLVFVRGTAKRKPNSPPTADTHFLLARICLSGVFIVSGIEKLFI